MKTLLTRHAPKALASFALSFCLIFAQACSLSSWEATAINIIKVLTPAAVNILTLTSLLAGRTVPAGDIATIQRWSGETQNDLAKLQDLITTYQKAEAGARPGILTEIQAAATTAETEIDSLLPVLHIVDPATQARVKAAVQLIATETIQLASVIPALQTAATSPTAARAQLGMVFAQHGKPLAARDFKSAYNAIMTAHSGNSEVDAAAASCVIR